MALFLRDLERVRRLSSSEDSGSKTLGLSSSSNSPETQKKEEDQGMRSKNGNIARKRMIRIGSESVPGIVMDESVKESRNQEMERRER